MKMTASGYGFVGLISLSYTNEPLGTRRRKKNQREKKGPEKNNDHSRCCISFQFVVCAYDSAAIHLDYFKACDE